MGRSEGYRKPKADYVKQYKLEMRLLANGVSIRQVAKLTGHSINTIMKLKRYI
ncbi:MAG: hypothetical protein MJZ71_09090 [Bacteroidales bacterium]|nr:hypothetical protein [Bacteroidales bacterium]